jgi:hypothetical protein
MPSARRDSMLRRNGARAARAVLMKGRTTVGTASRGGLGERAEGVGVADALRPLVDGVVGGRGDEDGVGDEGTVAVERGRPAAIERPPQIAGRPT